MQLSDADGPTAGAPVFPYGSAAAFRTALRDRFAAIAKADTRYSLDELQRQFARVRQVGVGCVVARAKTHQLKPTLGRRAGCALRTGDER